jgi:hypothetical protein
MEDHHSHLDVVANANLVGAGHVVPRILIDSVAMEEDVENTDIVNARCHIDHHDLDHREDTVMAGAMMIWMMMDHHGGMMTMTDTTTDTKRRKTVTVCATKVGGENVVEILPHVMVS